MSKLTEMSDFELSCAVAEKRGYPFVTNGGKVFADVDLVKFSSGKSGLTYSGRGFVEFSINNWVDMGPVIMENGIDIDWPVELLGDVGTCCIYRIGNTDISVDFNDKSEALRSAAICYLEMD